MKKFLFVSLLASAFAVVAMPPPGHMSAPDAVSVIQKENGGLPTNSALEQLNNTGVVVQSIISNEFVYVEFESEGKKAWLAAPKVELQTGQNIRFSDGTLVKEFYSRKHQRNFTDILFVSKVEAVKE